MARRLRVLLIGLSVLIAAPAFAAQDCGGDLQKLAQRREAALASINGLVASARGKKLDPEIFCVRSAPLNAVESEMIAYMEKNKDWCQVPDEAIANLKATHVKSVGFAAKACGVAAQIKKMKAQAEKNAAAGGAGGQPQAQPLPAGPL